MRSRLDMRMRTSTPATLKPPRKPRRSYRQVPVRQRVPGPHTLPQRPQFMLVRRSVSHPVLAMRSQSSKFVLQLAIAHVPVPHVDVAFASAHGVRHAPQSVSVVSGVSQPSLDVVLQSSKSALHIPIAQVSVAQVAVAFARMHGVMHAPQSVRVSIGVSQPSLVMPLQSAKPPLHEASTQRPVAQLAVAPGIAQGMPHVPQSVSVVSGVSQTSPGM